MKPVVSTIPEAQDALRLPIDELAMRVLRHFADKGDVNRHNLTNKPAWTEHGSGKELDEMMRALAEAYDWLERHGLVARDPAGGGSEWAFITRLGHKVLEDRDALEAVRAGHRLEVDLHPSIEQTARSQFLLGQYDLAVFSALREVEARVRQLSGADDSDIGMKLMADAFKEGSSLRDPAMDKGEAEAIMALFRGAIGTFKNPTSHRPVEYDDPTLASEIVLLADLLMRLLDRIEADQVDQ
ncbi:MAG TPA: TIGR02391 family protein [Solirubrobacterales bacterium]|nr:TIGR02391 family protein [Solirubrobacterales bacterium]